MLFNENQFGLISQLPLAVLSYQELEIKNLELKNLRQQGHSQQFFKDKILSDLAHEKLIKAVMVCFSDLEGCFKSLDYDKQFFIKNNENFTFDGSSVKGFASQEQSDLVLQVDWSSFYWLPGRVFGEGKVAIFANVLDRNGQLYPSDFRGILREFTENYQKNNKIHYNIAPEIEGFLLKGIDAEQNFTKQEGFKLVTTGGYYNSLPKDPLRVFIDSVAEAKRAMAFENEKDHPEVAPSQFELNYKYNTPVEACDQIQLYKKHQICVLSDFLKSAHIHFL